MADTPKEATILSLTKDIKAELSELQSRLDSRFSRSVKECESPDKAEEPNILDEIIGGLQDCDKHIADIIAFISSFVLPKIN